MLMVSIKLLSMVIDKPQNNQKSQAFKVLGFFFWKNYYLFKNGKMIKLILR